MTENVQWRSLTEAMRSDIFFIVLREESIMVDQCFRLFFSHFATMNFCKVVESSTFLFLCSQEEENSTVKLCIAE